MSPTHGTVRCYDLGCREEPCRAAKSAYLAKQRGSRPKTSAWAEGASIPDSPDETFTRAELLAYRDYTGVDEAALEAGA
ncbi:MAG: hypothetical protein M3404_01815 [Actinomycetota bacterium]|nr:hypothetical protein [Actinomycetota bacterium]